MTYLKNRFLYFLRKRVMAYRLRHATKEFTVDLPVSAVRAILKRNGLGFEPDGNPSWWYASLEMRRNEQDDLTKGILRQIRDTVPKEARILGTGCGTGWMLFWLAQHGFKKIDGFDYLPNVVQAAKEIAALGKLEARLWQMDGFAPKLEGSYDLIIAVHWLYTAWMGNYGNKPRSGEDRERLLSDVLANYGAHLDKGGLMIVELVDAIADHREPPIDIYPIRHTAEQVARCAAPHGLSIERKMFNYNHGHLPRMAYFLRKA